MSEAKGTTGEALAFLLDGTRPAAADDVPRVVTEAARLIGARAADIYLVDKQQRLLVPFGFDASPLDIEGTMAGRAYRSGDARTVEDGDRVLRWLPLVDGGARLGVLGVTFEPGEDDLDACVPIAELVAQILVSKRQFGDAIELTERRELMSLPAEFRTMMLPPLSFVARDASVAGILEPAYRVAGDCFDYALNADVLHFAVFDAVGHGLEATRLANMAVAAYRYSRRAQNDLAGIYATIDAAIEEQFGNGNFVTGQLASLDLQRGRLRWINAGHPHPVLLRRGNSIELTARPAVPMGLGHLGMQTVTIADVSLEPGDRVLLYSDGVTEARSEAGERFGFERLCDFLVRASSSDEQLPETVRRLARAILDHQNDRLDDDATVLLLSWHPAPRG